MRLVDDTRKLRNCECEAKSAKSTHGQVWNRATHYTRETKTVELSEIWLHVHPQEIYAAQLRYSGVEYRGLRLVTNNM